MESQHSEPVPPEPATPAANSHSPKRHETYYYSDGSIVIQIGDTLFRVHRMFLERDSPKLKERFGSITGDEPCSDARPIVLLGVSSDAFSDLLWMFYNDKYKFDWDVVTAAKWLNILEAASHFEMKTIREIAVEALSHHTLDPLHKLDICLKYGLDMMWASDAFHFIASRTEPLTLAEGQRFGMLYVLVIGDARERIAKKRVELSRSPTGMRCSCGYGNIYNGRCSYCSRQYPASGDEFKDLVQAAIQRFAS